MTLSIAVNAQGDIYLDKNGNLAMVTAIDATLQACSHAAQTVLGEMLLATDQGIPNFQTVWVGTPNINQFEASLRIALMAVEGVNQIEKLSIRVADNVLSYDVTIQTIYGLGSING